MRLVVLIPFIESQIMTRLAPMMLRWRDARFAPCEDSTPGERRGLPVSLVFLSPHNRVKPSSQQTINRLWQKLGRAASCFDGGMNILGASLPSEIANQHISGSCEQFEAAFRVLSGRARYFFLMEPDMLPIRPGWLGRLLHELPPEDASSGYWVRGSVAQCDGQYAELVRRHDWRIKGIRTRTLLGPARPTC
jgi:hypothetical protein